MNSSKNDPGDNEISGVLPLRVGGGGWMALITPVEVLYYSGNRKFSVIDRGMVFQDGNRSRGSGLDNSLNSIPC